MNNNRRKELNHLADELEGIQGILNDLQSEEDEYRDNMPENLSESERFQTSEEASENMSFASDNLELAIEEIRTAAGN